jgi:hypothetical protein
MGREHEAGYADGPKLPATTHQRQVPAEFLRPVAAVSAPVGTAARREKA